MIEHAPNAPEGSIETWFDWYASDIGPQDVILCRNTAPLIGVAFALLGARHPCYVLGRDIGAGLTALVKKMKANSILELTDKLRDYEHTKTEDLKDKGKDSAIANLKDKCECVRMFMQNAKSVQEVLLIISELFGEEKKNVTTLSTIHRAKGGEWDRVFILDVGLMPSKYATEEWQQQQEVNLIYVAVTRAKLDIIYIDSGDFQR